MRRSSHPPAAGAAPNHAHGPRAAPAASQLLTAAEVAELLAVSEETVFGWTRKHTIPFTRVHEQFRFNRAEILEWALARGLPVAPRLFAQATVGGGVSASLCAALEAGGIHYALEGVDRDTALRALVRRLPLADEAERELVCEFLLAREALGPTGIAEGIAIPHVRSPIVLRVAQPLVALCFLASPVDFRAHDGELVSTLFAIVAPNNRCHLQLLARIAAALHDGAFREALGRRAEPSAILAAARRLDAHAAAQSAPPAAEPESQR